MGATENFQRKAFILLIYFVSNRSSKRLDRLGNPARTSLDVLCLCRESYPSVGSQSAKSAFSVHRWCTPTPDCTREAASTHLPPKIGGFAAEAIPFSIHIATPQYKENAKNDARSTAIRNPLWQ
jgi:hypothetical protein